MKESTLTRSIMAYLNGLPDCKAVKFHGSALTQAGTPDVLAVRNGHAIWLEVKTTTGKTTAIQDYRLDQWRQAGCTVAVVRSLAEVRRLLHP